MIKFVTVLLTASSLFSCDTKSSTQKTVTTTQSATTAGTSNLGLALGYCSGSSDQDNGLPQYQTCSAVYGNIPESMLDDWGNNCNSDPDNKKTWQKGADCPTANRRFSCLVVLGPITTLVNFYNKEGSATWSEEEINQTCQIYEKSGLKEIKVYD